MASQGVADQPGAASGAFNADDSSNTGWNLQSPARIPPHKFLIGARHKKVIALSVTLPGDSTVGLANNTSLCVVQFTPDIAAARREIVDWL